jgi:hypothetical protein
MIRVICLAGVSSPLVLIRTRLLWPIIGKIAAPFTTRVHMVVVYDTIQICFGPLTM